MVSPRIFSVIIIFFILLLKDSSLED